MQRRIVPYILTAALTLVAPQSINTATHTDTIAEYQRYGVLVIDMQPDILSRSDPQEVATALAEQKRILNYCAEHSIPTAILEFGDREGTISDITNIVSRIPQSTIIQKDTDDTQSHLDIAAYFRERSVTDVFLMGGWATLCVRNTADNLRNVYGPQQGFRMTTSPTVLLDPLISDYNKSIEYYEQKGTVVTDLTSLDFLVSRTPSL